MPYFCMEKIERALNDVTKPVKGSRVLVLGVAYKAGVGDTRESPALKIIRLLDDRGASVSYHDPFVPELPRWDLRSADLDAAVAEADLVVLVTAHPGIDHEQIARTADRLLDLRGVTRAVHAPGVQQL
jgi:UDP-N-acetyl-D-glucosamine dehydrogenase